MNKFCPSCGQEITEEGTFCINCGYNLSQLNQVQDEVQVQVQNPNPNQNNYNNNNFNGNYNQNVQMVPTYTNGMAITGFVLGIVSLLCCCYTSILAVVGIVFAIVGLNNANTHGGIGKGFAIAGIVLNSISILIAFIYIAIFFVAGL